MSQKINHKRGATFSYSGLVTLPTGTWTASCDLDNPVGVKVSDTTVTLSVLGSPGANGETHSILIEVAASTTANWPVGTLSGDIRFQDNAGVIVFTSTFYISVTKGITDAS